MMMDPQGYIKNHKDDTFEQLIRERDSLVKEIKYLETIVFSENKTDEEWMISPGPDVQYQVNLSYLAELCRFLEEKYNREIVWGEENDGEMNDSIEIKKIIAIP